MNFPTTQPTNARGESSGAPSLVIENSPAAPSPAAGSISSIQSIESICICSGCGSQRTAHGVWTLNPQPSTLNHPVSHGLCPDCVNAYSQSRPVSPALRNARILRTMIQGNMDMATRLLQIGDPAMAIAELTQALVKIDQTLAALAE